jgi:hypothetical protein
VHAARSTRVLVVAALLATTSIAGATRASTSAAAAGCDSHALVVVDTGDTGNGVHHDLICFSGTITGIEALQLAGSNPETISYGGLGLAVCKLFGVGDASDTAHCPGGWVYFRAARGSAGWSGSGLGASNTQVHDGDVEGWKYGGGQPPFVPFCSIATCAPPPTSPRPTAAASDSTPTGPGEVTTPGPATGNDTPGSTAAPIRGANTPTTTTSPSGPSSDVSSGDRRGRRDGSSVDLAASGTGGGGGSGSPVGVLIVTAALAGVAAVAVGLRRRRGTAPG